MIMCLSSKQVSGDGFDWPQGMVKSGGVEIPRPATPAQPVRLQQQKQRQQPAQQQQQQGPQLRCPRCDSTNTKFCYYNNYSRTQPRHFCKACRRHWTEGGTLRNVPVGGGRKAKRPKTSHTSSAADSPAGGRRGSGVDGGSTNMPASTEPPPLLPPLSFAPDILSPALLQPSLGLSTYANSSYHLGPLLSLPSTPQFVGAASAGVVDAGGYSFSTSPTFPSFLNLTGQEDLPAIGSDTALTTGSTTTPPLWELLPPPTRSGGRSGSSITTTTSSGLTALESSSPSSGYWGNCWDDLTGFLSADLEHPPAPDAPPLHHYFELS